MIKTKRFAYKLLLDYYDELDRELEVGLGITAYEFGCTTIEGVRKVGKTTLLRQLYEHSKEISQYMDCSGLDEDFDFNAYYEGCLQRGIKRVYLDEVCKIPEELIADFVSETKYYSAQILITITGSTRGSVSKLSLQIGRGRTLVLPPIMYIERLAWENGNEVEDYFQFDFSSVSTYDKFINYLKVQNTISEDAKLDYVGSVVEDTVSMWLETALLSRLSYLYRFADRCRTENELDLVYSIPTGVFEYKVAGVEAKDRKHTSVDREHISRYLRIKDNLKLEDLCLSCSDEIAIVKDEYAFYRGDLIVIALELEYCNRCRLNFTRTDLGLFCEETVSELLKKYNLI